MNIITSTPLSKVHKNPPISETLEQSITDLELDSIEKDRTITDLEIAIEELKQKNGSKDSAADTTTE